jgi:hypothetical protein
MAYGHAERNLAALRQLEVETRQLLESLDQLDPEQSAWLQGSPVSVTWRTSTPPCCCARTCLDPADASLPGCPPDGRHRSAAARRRIPASHETVRFQN